MASVRIATPMLEVIVNIPTRMRLTNKKYAIRFARIVTAGVAAANIYTINGGPPMDVVAIMAPENPPMPRVSGRGRGPR